MSKQVFKEVEALIQKAMKKNQKEIEAALMKPLHPSYPFSTNCIYFLIGRPGAGKSYWLWSHILIIERLFKLPYYHKIIFCSTSGKADKTAEIMSKEVKSPIIYLREGELMDYLKKHVKRKIKYYSMVKHVMSRMKETNEEMQRLINK